MTEAGLQYLGSEMPRAPQTIEEVLAMWERPLRLNAGGRPASVAGGWL